MLADFSAGCCLRNPANGGQPHCSHCVRDSGGFPRCGFVETAFALQRLAERQSTSAAILFLLFPKNLGRSPAIFGVPPYLGHTIIEMPQLHLSCKSACAQTGVRCGKLRFPLRELILKCRCLVFVIPSAAEGSEPNALKVICSQSAHRLHIADAQTCLDPFEGSAQFYLACKGQNEGAAIGGIWAHAPCVISTERKRAEKSLAKSCESFIQFVWQR